MGAIVTWTDWRTRALAAEQERDKLRDLLRDLLRRVIDGVTYAIRHGHASSTPLTALLIEVAAALGETP